MIIFIYVYDFGFTNDNGIHFGQIAIESLDEDRFFISYIGSMRVDDYISVALCGDSTMNMLWGCVGWYVNLRKLYAPGSFNGFVLMLYYF